MTERDVDSDIDFDFFEEEPATQESSRTEALIRLVGLIAFAILIIVLLVFWVQSCREAGKTKTYKSYMSKVSQDASSSQQIGRQLNQALLGTGVKQAALRRQISNLARQEQLNVERARGI